MLPVFAVVVFVGMSQFTPLPVPRREITLADHGTLIIDGDRQGRSEHGFSQRAGYRPPDRLRRNGLEIYPTALSRNFIRRDRFW